MDALLTAIIAKFNAEVTLNAYHLYAEQAPQDVELPYLTYTVVSAEPVETFTDTSESSLIQFSVWDDSPSPLLVTQIAGIFKVAFDWCSLTIPGKYLVSFARESERLVQIDPLGWQYSIDYRIEVQ